MQLWNCTLEVDVTCLGLRALLSIRVCRAAWHIVVAATHTRYWVHHMSKRAGRVVDLGKKMPSGTTELSRGVEPRLPSTGVLHRRAAVCLSR